MGTVFTTFDLVVFFAALITAMVVGLLAGRKEEKAEDYFLAGREIPWWGVAGSIFGSNVSANHMVGMMGIGFSVGFAQTHFELGAIAGLMLLCYGFLPVYRKLEVYTLSEYLGRRYDERSRVAYAVIMVIIMAVVQMVPALYIGGRSVCVLLGGDAVERVQVESDQGGDGGPLPSPAAVDEDTPEGQGNAESDAVASTSRGSRTTLNVNPTYYQSFVIALAVIAASYTVLGGLKAVIWTDVIQSFLLLASGILLAVLAFGHLGGWGAMIELDRAGADKMHLYLPSTHQQLPWTGVLTGLMMTHFFYWGTNQFIVQRALSARSDAEARLGIVAAGFLKMLIPFFAIGTGVAAFYLFQSELPGQVIDPDTAFTELVKLVIPVGFGVIGLIAAGVIGAILSSIDSMMNSAATIVTMDLYKRFIHPQADDRQLIRIGRLTIVALVTLAAFMAIYFLDPNSKQNFFLQIADYQSYFTPGLLVAFFLGMFWPRSTATGSIVTILSGIFFSWLVEYSYNSYHLTHDGLAGYFGPQLNFFHRVIAVVALCVAVHVVVSCFSRREVEKERLVWSDLGGHEPQDLRNLGIGIILSIGVFAALGLAMYAELLTPTWCAVLGGLWTFGIFSRPLLLRLMGESTGEEGATRTPISSTVRNDRFWASVLCALAVFMMYYFY